MSDIKITDNSELFLSALKDARHKGLTAIGMAAETNAKRDPEMPVVTGLARNSITYAVSGYEAGTQSYRAANGKGNQPPRSGSYSGTLEGKKDEFVVVGSGVEYFRYIELGGVNRKAHHVLRRAATEHGEQYKKLMQDAMENA